MALPPDKEEYEENPDCYVDELVARFFPPQTPTTPLIDLLLAADSPATSHTNTSLPDESDVNHRETGKW